MSQRFSGHERHDEWPTPDWVTEVLLGHMHLAIRNVVWEPAAGAGQMVRRMKKWGLTVVASRGNFLDWMTRPDDSVTSIITNPPYGPSGILAKKFVEHSLSLDGIDLVAMLLQVDFDSGRTRTHLFRDEPRWAMKIVLLKRIVWFENPNGKSGSSTNHAWYVWRRGNTDPPRIVYAE